MKWWDFTDIEFVFIFALACALIALVFFVLISLIVTNELQKKHDSLVEKESVTTRVFIINLKRNVVTYFNKSNIKRKRNMDLSSFYSEFHPNDQEKIKQWFYQICLDSKSADQYIEADVLTNKGKLTVFSLIKLIKYDSASEVIHLESYILRYITPNNNSSKKAVQPVFVKRSDLLPLIESYKHNIGFTYDIRFFYMRQKALANDKIERYITMSLRNVIFPFASSTRRPRYLLSESSNEIILVDLSIKEKEDAIQLANSMAYELKKCISINGYGDQVSFAIGIAENKKGYDTLDIMIEKSQEAVMAAQRNKQETYLLKSNRMLVKELSIYQEEFENIINHPFSLRYLYRPIVNCEENKIIGYFNYIKTYNSPFNSMEEISKYAAKVGKNKEVFATVSKVIVSKFANEKFYPGSKLFYLVSLLDIDHMIDVLSQIPKINEANVVLVFDEQEIDENASELELLTNSLKKLKQYRFTLGLLLQDKDLLLDPSLYTNFDYYITGASMLGEIRINNRVRLSMHTLIESLLKYNKPIIATDLEGWQAIELIIKSGIDYVSSETLAGSNDMLLPIEKKKMDKLHQMYEKYK